MGTVENFLRLLRLLRFFCTSGKSANDIKVEDSIIFIVCESSF